MAPADSTAFQFSFLDRWLTPPPLDAPLPTVELPRPILVEPLPPRNQREEVARLRATFLNTIAANISSGSELIRTLEKEQRNASIPTTVEAFDQLLGGGLVRGRLIELAGRRSSGRFSVVLSALVASTTMGLAAALVDLGDHFDPQLAGESGVDLRRLLWVRPQTMKQAVAAAEMLVSTGFQLVILDAGLHPVRGRRAPDAAWVRLARAAEAHGGALLVSTPFPLTATAAEGVVLAQYSRPAWSGRGRAPRLLSGISSQILLERHRHLRPGRTSMLSFAPEERVSAAGDVRIPAGRTTSLLPSRTTARDARSA